jgi:hypothetical protein
MIFGIIGCQMSTSGEEITGIFRIVGVFAVWFTFSNRVDVKPIESRVEVFDECDHFGLHIAIIEFDLTDCFLIGVHEFGGSKWACPLIGLSAVSLGSATFGVVSGLLFLTLLGPAARKSESGGREERGEAKFQGLFRRVHTAFPSRVVLHWLNLVFSQWMGVGLAKAFPDAVAA